MGNNLRVDRILKMRPLLHALFLSLILAIVIASGGVPAQEEGHGPKKSFLFQWTDEKGIVHITDDESKIPEKYQSKAQKVEQPEEKETGERYDRSAPDRGASYDTGAGGEDEESRKFEWQDRLHDWKSRLADAEKRYQQLEKERNELFGQWGGPAYAPIEVRQKAVQLDQSMQEAQKQIDEAKKMINDVIPEEARKAGIPPGWLRE